MTEHYITWWNVENLFDVKDAPIERRPEAIRRKIKSDLKNWTRQVLEKKLNNLAWVIKQLNNGKGPDIIGLCEIENSYVLDKLLSKLDLDNRKYDIIHSNSADSRGIDIAFIYDLNKYTFNDEEFFQHGIIKRFATREIIQATLKTKKDNELVLIGNHWPSRTSGQYESEPFRIIAAETLSYFIQRIQEIKGNDASIVVMGDFNDEPFNRSLTDYALSTRSIKKVRNGRNPNLYNLMWDILNTEYSSYFFGGNQLMIDQFLVSKGIVKSNSKLRLRSKSQKVEAFDGMVTGRYNKPVRFGQEEINEKGFSDHLPISFILDEK